MSSNNHYNTATKLPILTVLILLLIAFPGVAQKMSVSSPNGKIKVSLYSASGTEAGTWYLKVFYSDSGKVQDVISRIDLGLVRSDQDFSKELRFVKAGKPLTIEDHYEVPHGKRKICDNQGNEVTVSFVNQAKSHLNIIVRAYNDGMVFRYEFPEKTGTFTVKDELTSYSVHDSVTRWMERWNPANEGLYTQMKGENIQQREWCYPALFNTADKSCWFLLHEADVNRAYCGSKLSNMQDRSGYKITFPDQRDGNGMGSSLPVIKLPWKSPWRVAIIGSLAKVAESTLVQDVSPASVLKNTSWIKPGLVSWNYWSDNHGTKDYKTVCAFADLAARMNWPYTLLDWEWDAMANGGNLEDAVRYILSKGVKPLIWYNSGGKHTYVPATPRDRMLTHENRVEEFTKLKKMGIAGVKVDFFESEKQDMINYYLDILEDAAKFEMMVYFHGCIVPRGWERTYPNLMTSEAVRGAEWYNNGPEFTNTAPEHNSILPFTRNVVGPMDYTPVTFTNSQFPHLTSYGHEMALSVLFESGLQHFADRPEGYDALPDAARAFLKDVPNAWDDIRLLDGYPGKDAIVARRKGNKWYIGGINSELREKRKTLKLDFLPEGVRFKLTLIVDGKHDKVLDTQYMVTDSKGSLDVKMLRRGGFAAVLIPMNEG